MFGRRANRTIELPEQPPREPQGLTTQLADAVVRRLLETPLADTLIYRVVEALTRSAALERLVLKVVTDLEASPAVEALVDRQVVRVMEALRESEGLRLLIQEQAGDYLEHLGRHPEPVQRLIQEQSRGVVREWRDTLRERALAADDVVDTWARRVLGRA